MRAAIIDNRISRKLRGLYAVTPDTRDTSWLVDAVRAAVRGGATAVQYRNKSADAELRELQAAALRSAVDATDALLIVNDDVDIALRVGAHGVHVGEDDASIRVARETLGPDALIGVSCYDDLARSRALVSEGADYIAFGSFFPSQVKPGARRAHLSLLRDASALGVPIVAIGGITAQNAATLAGEGAHAVAVISAVFGHRDPAAIENAAREIVRCFTPR